MVRGTPASGKTTLMQLVANRLLETLGHEHAVHILTDWAERDVKMEGSWKGYLERTTGVRGYQWLNHLAYLLFSEAQAQESYWNGELWAAFFESIKPINPKARLSCSSHRMARRTGATQAFIKKLI